MRWSARYPPGVGAALVASALSGSPAQGATFDEASGQIVFAPSAAVQTFDGTEGPLLLRVFDSGGRPVQPSELIDSVDPLQGKAAMGLGGRARFATVELGSQTQLEGRRVRVSLWQRPVGTQIRAYLVWYAGDESEALASLDFRFVQQVALLRLMPSGRATDDGWLELSSGPVDFMLGGRLAPGILIFDDYESLGGRHAPDLSARALVDALEVEDLGPATVPDAVCSRVNEDAVCGEHGVCLMGRCADHAAVTGPLFEAPEDARRYVDRRRFELETFAGHGAARARFSDFFSTLEVLAESPDKGFWARLREGWYALADGHGSPPLIGYAPPPQLGICLALGEADLIEGAPETPLVFSVDRFHPVATRLFGGEALVAVDGLEPAAWGGLVKHRLRYNGDPGNAAYVETLQLLRVAAISGARLRFARCPSSADCSSPETVDINLAEVEAPVWSDEPLRFRSGGCPVMGAFRASAPGLHLTKMASLGCERRPRPPKL